MDDISPEFNEKERQARMAIFNPKMVELVKLLARISAHQDYNEFLSSIQDSQSEPQ